ncbi:enoyl-CoA hydratase/isomerase family protein [Chloroflexota bacterium]
MPKDYSGYKYFKVEVDEVGVAEVTINRPEVLNALHHDGRMELHTIWPDLGTDNDVKSIIFTGSGRGFCAGGDIKEVAARHAEGMGTELGATHPTKGGVEGLEGPRMTSVGAGGTVYYAQQMFYVNKPIIGAINGVATGMGCVMALSCDIVIAADTATFGDHHVRIGLVGGDGCCTMWPLLSNHHIAMEYVMTGDLMDAKEALRVGLVNKVVPLTDLMPVTRALAKRLAQGPTVAIGLIKRTINKRVMRHWELTQDYAFSSEIRTFNTEDHLEGSKAFAEKREPRFVGR